LLSLNRMQPDYTLYQLLDCQQSEHIAFEIWSSVRPVRHSTASHLLRAGVDINTIRGWLGHVSLYTTNIYAEIDLETKAKALATCDIGADRPRSKPWRRQPALMEFPHGL
jgi:site-specific recombinase XerD